MKTVGISLLTSSKLFLPATLLSSCLLLLTRAFTVSLCLAVQTLLHSDNRSEPVSSSVVSAVKLSSGIAGVIRGDNDMSRLMASEWKQNTLNQRFRMVNRRNTTVTPWYNPKRTFFNQICTKIAKFRHFFRLKNPPKILSVYC